MTQGFRRCRKPCDCRKSGSLHFFENISRAACACSAASRPCRESLASQALLRIRRTCRRIRTKPPGAAAPEAPKYLSTERGLPALPEALMRLSKNSGVDKGPQPLMCNPALTTSASERMKTQRFSYFAGFAARELMREAKPVKARKSGVQPLFRHSDEGFRRCRKPSFFPVVFFIRRN